MSGPYVYVQSERPSDDTSGLWTVGHYQPDGMWVAESDHSDEKIAAARVHWLNGGCDQELLAALQSLLHCAHPAHVEDAFLRGRLIGARELAHEAIAKATGAQP